MLPFALAWLAGVAAQPIRGHVFDPQGPVAGAKVSVYGNARTPYACAVGPLFSDCLCRDKIPGFLRELDSAKATQPLAATTTLADGSYRLDVPDAGYLELTALAPDGVQTASVGLQAPEDVDLMLVPGQVEPVTVTAPPGV